MAIFSGLLFFVINIACAYLVKSIAFCSQGECGKRNIFLIFSHYFLKFMGLS